MEILSKIFQSCLLIFLMLFSSLFACTDFILDYGSKNVVVGRSMEFGSNLESQIVIFPKNEKRVSKIKNRNGLSWTSKYAYIAVTSFKTDLVADGMNEKGLSIGTLWFTDVKYPKIPTNARSKTIALEDLSNWILGSFANISEVKKGLQKIYIWAHVIKALKEIPPIHLSLHDQSGKSIVIEFVDGKMNLIDNEVGVLTNNPAFDWHVTNLSNYINLTAINKGKVVFDGTAINPVGQGSGLLGLPGDWTPPSRFVKIAILKNFVKKPKSVEESKNLAFHLLNTVDIPYGVVRSKDGKEFDHTQWIVVKDLVNKKLSYRTYKDLNIHTIDLMEEIPKLNSKKKIIPMVGAI